SDAVAAGRAAALVLLTDPVKTVDVAYVRGLAQELRHGLETAAVERAQHDLDAARDQAADARARLAGAADDLHRALDDLGARPALRRPRRAAARAAERAARARGADARGPRRGRGAARGARRERADTPAPRAAGAPRPSRTRPPPAPLASRRPPARPARARGEQRHRRPAPAQQLRSERAGLRRDLPPPRRAARGLARAPRRARL